MYFHIIQSNAGKIFNPGFQVVRHTGLILFFLQGRNGRQREMGRRSIVGNSLVRSAGNLLYMIFTWCHITYLKTGSNVDSSPGEISGLIPGWVSLLPGPPIEQRTSSVIPPQALPAVQGRSPVMLCSFFARQARQ